MSNSNSKSGKELVEFLKQLSKQGEVGVTEVRISNEQIAAAGGVGNALKAAIEKAFKDAGKQPPTEDNTTPGATQSTEGNTQSNEGKTCCGECQQGNDAILAALDTIEPYLVANGTDLHPALNNLSPADCLSLLKIHETGGKMFIENTSDATTPESTAVYFISTLLHLLDAFNNRNEDLQSEN